MSSRVFDAIVIAGGGVTEDLGLPPWIARRFDAAIESQPQGPFIALSGGTFHKPSPLDAFGRPVFDAYAGVAYLLSKGVPEHRIVHEISSYDTVGNAFFTRVQHTDVRSWRKLLVITSRFHMQRTEAIFRWIFSLHPGSGYDLSFVETSDDGMPAPDLRARIERERASLESLQKTAARLRSLADVHRWLYAEHEAYRAGSVSTARAVDPDLARMY